MDFYGLNLQTDIKKKDYELLGPWFGGSNKSYIKSLLGRREQYDQKYVRTDSNVVGDVLIQTDREFPGANAYEGRIDGFSLNGLIDGGNYWVNRTCLSYPKFGQDGAAFTSDLGWSQGGYNGSYPTDTEAYTNSTNSWRGLANCRPRHAGNCASIDSDHGLAAAGHNGSYVPNTDRISYSENSWTARSNVNRVYSDFACAELTQDLSLKSCGGNASNARADDAERYSNSANTWTNVTSASLPHGQASPYSCSFNTELILQFGGENDSGWANDVTMYNNSSDSWTVKTSFDFSSQSHQGFAQTSNTIIHAGNAHIEHGKRTSRYNLSSNTWIGRTNIHDERFFNSTTFALNSSQGVLAGSHGASTQTDLVKRFKDTVANSFSNGETLETYQHPNNAVPFDVDSDKHIIFTNDVVSTTDEIKGIVVSALFNQKKADIITSGYWTQRNPCIPEKVGPAGFALTSDSSIIAGGRDSSLSRITTTSKFSESQNSWIDRASFSLARSHFRGMELTSDLGIITGGNNGTSPYYVNNNDRYTSSSNNWTARTVYPSVIQTPCQFNLTTDLGVLSGGINGVGYVASDRTDRFSESGNSWTSLSTPALEIGYNEGFKLTSDGGINCGGYRESPSTVKTDQSERFSNSANSWTATSNIPLATYGHYGFELTSNHGMVGGGWSSSNRYEYESWKLSAAENVYNSRAKTITNNSFISAGVGLSSSTGYFTSGEGSGGNYNTTTERYTDSEPVSIVAPTFDLTFTGNDDESQPFELQDQALDTLIRTENYEAGGWTSRTDLNTIRAGLMGFQLTTDLGITSGGTNATTLGTTERYSDTGNSWTGRTALNNARSIGASFSLTSDLGIIAFGWNGSYTSLTERYSDTGNSWTNRTSGAVVRSHGPAGIGLTTNSGVVAGGHNASRLKVTEKYSDSENTWTTKDYMTEERNSLAGFSLATGEGIASGGHNGTTYLGFSEKYSDAGDGWSMRAEMGTVRRQHAGFNLTSDTGLIAGGRDIQTTVGVVEKYSDSNNQWTTRPTGIAKNSYAGFSLSSNQGITAGGQDNVTVLGSTERYKDTTQAALPSAGIWTIRSSFVEPRYNSAGFQLDSGQGLYAGGVNTTTYVNFADRYDNDVDTWTSRTGLNSTRRGLAGFSLTTGQGITTGGHNGSGKLGDTERFDDTGNSWTNRTSLSPVRIYPEGFNLTTDLGVVAGGDNGPNFLDNTDRYSDSGNSWTSRTALNTARNYFCAFPLTSDLGMVGGGYDNTRLSSTERYSNASNAWSFRIRLKVGRSLISCVSLSNDSGIFYGGYNGNDYLKTTEYYSDSKNTMISKQSPSIFRRTSKGFSLTTNQGMLAGGANSSYPNGLNMSERYDDVAVGDIQPYKNLRLKFNLPRDIQGDSWSLRTENAAGRGWPNGASLDTTKGVLFGGWNGSILTKTEVFDDSLNVYINKSTMPSGIRETGGAKVDADNVMWSSGNTGSGRSTASARFSYSSNLWVNRAQMNQLRDGNQCFELTSDYWLSGSGDNGSMQLPERYQNSSDSWSSRTAMNTPQRGNAMFTISSDGGVSGAGVEGSRNDTERYSNSSNAWTVRSDTPFVTYGPGSFSLGGSNQGMSAAGYNGYAIPSAIKFNDTGNIWVSKSDVILSVWYPGHWANGQHNGIVSCGNNSSYVGNTQKYTDGETSFTGFAIQLLK